MIERSATANVVTGFPEVYSVGMSWNHRVIRRTSETGSVSYQIHEVYYDEQDRVEAWTESPVAPMGETLHELRDELGQFLRALDSPVLVEHENAGTVTLAHVVIGD